MARTIVDSNLKDRTARSRLKARGKPYFRLIEPGLHLGYRKPRGRRGRPAPAGAWVIRVYLGQQAYDTKTLDGVADDFSDADGVAVLSFKQAQNKAREAHVQRAHAAAGVAGPLDVKAALEMYLEGREGEGKDTSNQRHHAKVIVPELGTAVVSELTTKTLSEWLHGLAKAAPRIRTAVGETQRHRPIAGDDGEAVRRRQSSANRIWNTFRAALNHAWQQGAVPSDSAWRRVKSFRNVDAARVRYLTIAESKRLINGCDPEFRPLVIAALQTGARYGELCRLRVGDFDPDSGTVLIRLSKSGKSRRIVLTTEGAQFFGQLCAGRDSGELMLHRGDGAAWGCGHQARHMVEACKRAKITPPATIHTARHTWASLSIMAGMSLQVAARNLGHVDTSMVEKHYGHLSESFVTDEIRKSAPQFGLAKSSVAVLQ